MTAEQTESPSPYGSVVPGAFNLRDFSGIRCGDEVIGPGGLFRCDLLHRVDVAVAEAWLDQQGVTTLVDLRTFVERETDGFMPSSERRVSLHHPLLDEVWSWEDERSAEHPWFLRDRTIEMYERHPDRIVAVLEEIAATDGAALFHCTAGKDRTGVIASALLGVIGVDRDDIVADYARSAAGLVRMVAWYRAKDPDRPHDAELERQVLERGASPHTMAGVIDHLVAKHGSFGEWLASCSDDDELAARLRAKVLGPRGSQAE